MALPSAWQVLLPAANVALNQTLLRLVPIYLFNQSLSWDFPGGSWLKLHAPNADNHCCCCCCKSLQSCPTLCDSVRPHRQQPTRLSCPWDSLGKNTGVGCHFLLQCMKVKSEREVAQSCPTLSHPMDYSLSGSFIHGIFQARVLELGAIAFSENKNHYI